MIRILVRLSPFLAAALAFAVAPATAQKAEPAPKPQTYLCPHATDNAIDCYLDAIDHLYTMCRNVKSIEIIEFGYAKSDEGVNGAKTEYCIEKHGNSLKGPFQSAVHEAGKNKAVVEALNSLRDYWVLSLAGLKWRPPETDEEYKARTAEPYGVFRARAMLVRAAMPVPSTAAVPPAKPKTKAATTATAPAKTKSAN
jgi:hypothetical protein